MGNCLTKSDAHSPSEITPYDTFTKRTTTTVPTAVTVAGRAATTAASVAGTIKLYGPSTTPSTVYLRIAVQYKATTSLHFTPTNTLASFFSSPNLVLQIGSDSATGTRTELLQFIDSQLPNPPLVMTGAEEAGFEAMPVVFGLVALQHRSVTWHLGRLVRWAQDMASRRGGGGGGGGGGKKEKKGIKGVCDPAVGSLKMEVAKFARSYAQLLEFMLEHAQMEERVVFHVLDKADKELCKAAHKEHARDLPMMNGIKEDIKSFGVLDTASPAFQEAIRNIANRLKVLLAHCKEHFEEEERNVLPLLQAVELSKDQQLSLMEKCIDLMQGTHSNLFNFVIDGLHPHEAMYYLDLIIRCKDEEQVAFMLQRLIM